MTTRDHRCSGPRRGTAVIAFLILLTGAANSAIAQPQVTAPQPTVPEIFTLMGQWVRVAYNGEGFATLGYRAAQQSIGEKWMLLEVGLTVRAPAKNYTFKREFLSLKTPDGTMIPLATQKEYGQVDLRALNMRTKAIRDSINYFPVDATRGCVLQFFSDLSGSGPKIAFDELELSSDRGCVGRLYFNVPDGIKIGQHWLHVRFSESEVQVPFRILTKEEQKTFEKSWDDIKKAHDASYKK